MKRVIITGATGFVGANLARRLLHEGHYIHLFVQKDYKPWRIESIRNDVNLHVIDFCDIEGLSSLISNIKPDWVFHLAAHGAYSSQTNIQRIIRSNIIGTINLVEACLQIGFEAFVNTGSSSEYGFKNHAASEMEWIDPNSFYAVTKASASLYCRYIAQKHSVHISTLRLYSVYGPYEEPTRLIPTLILYGLKNEFPKLVNPDIARDYIFVEDVIDAFILAASLPSLEYGSIYNVGTGTQTSLKEVVGVVKQSMHITNLPEWGSMPNREWDTNVWVANIDKIQNDLGWQSQNIFEKGLELTLKWFHDNSHITDFYYNHRNEPI